jgi:GNAT superfamily N-acetyltransferase
MGRDIRVPPAQFRFDPDMSDAIFSSEDFVGRKLDEPAPSAFDCAREEQNRFLHERAWRDQQAWLSTTYLYYEAGVVVAYATAAMDAVILGTREKPRSIPYKFISSLKVLQLGVDRRFQGQGVGSQVLIDIIALARAVAKQVGCRYVTLDAQPDLVTWYQSRGFQINRTWQKQRIEAAAGRTDATNLPVSMRFDLLEGQ